MVKKVFALLAALVVFMTMSAFAADTAVQSEEEHPDIVQRKKDVIIMQIDNYGAISNGSLTWIDLENKNVIPYIKDSRTMVPLRFLAEEMGATVGYDEQTRGITITLGATVMELWVDKSEYYINGEAFVMDCATEILEGRTFVPVRFVSESLGKSVKWLDAERMVVVTPVSAPWNESGAVEQAVMAEVRLALSPIGRNSIR
ncbi:MAG: copper amine oxidase N-terminal domain-containing protein [Clostridia bacterium]|nr:copper amine oxidase N-terminal domain-containing protein [Clostridia bacterium]